jgi:5-methylcytosine-specific restriction endonuclease McrA
MKVKRTRNNGQWTEARYWQQVRSSLRQGFRYWLPIKQCKMASRRKYIGNNKRQKWEYKCAHCHQWFMDKQVQVDHVIPVGSLRCTEDIKGFLERLTTETGFQTLCKPCHQVKTNREKIAKNNIKKA